MIVSLADTVTPDRFESSRALPDIAANRPALSRWHPDFKDAFAAHMSGKN